MIDSLMNHVSIRKFKTTPIPEPLLLNVLEAGTRASTTGNMQVYSIVITTSPEIKRELSPCHFNQPMVVQAPAVLTFCADFNRFSKWCRSKGAEPGYGNFLSFFTAAIDALLVAQNACIAAEELGLGICYLGTTTYMAGRIIEILGLPSGVVPVTSVVMGYPDESPGLTDRLPLGSVIHRERYRDYSDDDIEAAYREKEGMAVYRQFVKENQVNSLAHVFTDIRYKKEDNVLFSNRLMEVLENQGFLGRE